MQRLLSRRPKDRYHPNAERKGYRLTQDHIERMGIGTDLHRLEPGRALRLGGIEVAFDRGLRGHSDGDVVLHAVIDAICGAAGLPDIGEHFPDTDPQYKDCDSRTLVAKVVEEITELGYAVANLDVTVQAERPKLSPYKDTMRDRIAGLVGISSDRVSVKAKTNEGMDSIGRGDAIGCIAVVGLTKRG